MQQNHVGSERCPGRSLEAGVECARHGGHKVAAHALAVAFVRVAAAADVTIDGTDELVVIRVALIEELGELGPKHERYVTSSPRAMILSFPTRGPAS